jgi:hypothetical protein
MWVKIDGKPVQLTLMNYQEGVVRLWWNKLYVM